MDVKVSITRATGEVAIMTFVTVGKGNILPRGAEWVDKSAATWMREPSAANINDEIVRSAFLTVEGPIQGWRIVQEAEVPTDRTYRNALRDRAGKLEHDMPAARELHREMIRHARARKFIELDGEWMRAQGQGQVIEAATIEGTRQALRDAPEDSAIEAVQTTDELKALWPESLLGPMKGA